MGKHVQVRRHRYTPPPPHTFWGTMFWVVPTMLALALVGFFLGRDLFAPRYLESGTVRVNRLVPVRILTPEEAEAAARDEPSHVWKDGVKNSDIPDWKAPSERRRRSPRPRVATPTPAPDTGDTPPTIEPAPAPDHDDANIPQD